MKDTDIVKNNMKSLQITSMAMIFGIVTFMAVGVFMTFTEGPVVPIDQETLYMIAGGIVLLTILSVAGGNFIFKKKIAALDPTQDIQSRMIQYRTAVIIRLALMEMPAFVSCVALLILGDYTLLAGAALSVLAMLYFMPKAAVVFRDLGINAWDV
ncbi:MAG: hypothetical protein V2A54_04945 [Bacteroidota bacterium]